MGTLQRKASTTNSHSSSLQPNVFFKNLQHHGIIQHKASKPNIPFNSLWVTLKSLERRRIQLIFMLFSDELCDNQGRHFLMTLQAFLYTGF